MGRSLVAVILAAAFCLLFSESCFGQNMPRFDTSIYAALADIDSQGTIEPGTKISSSNWQQYKRFLPFGLQALYSGKFFWKVTNDPDYLIEVGATVPIGAPAKYKQDTEAGGGQAKLVPAGTGGYSIVNYRAGVPFPKPAGDLIGYQLMFNNYYQYQPAVLFNYYDLVLVDRYDNRTSLSSLEIQNNLGHVSDVGYPIVRPESQNVFIAIFNEVLLPEQSKYTSVLSLVRDDPTLPQELYVFLPSLRRSLRLSTAARCSPTLGTDFVNDDNRGFSGLTNQFTATLLGHKRILNLMHMERGKRHELANWVISANMVGWPRQVLGRWELRDAYIYNLQPTASNKNYCYGSKIMYIDAQTQTLIFVDIYDKEQKFWKCFTNFYSPVPVNDGLGSEAALQGDTTSTMFDFQNNHASFAWPSKEVTLNHAVPEQYQDTKLYASPAGLSQVMK